MDRSLLSRKLPQTRVGNFSAIVRTARTSHPDSTASSDAVQQNRQAIAQMCKMLLGRSSDASGNGGATPASSAAAHISKPLPPLSPRLRQTLQYLLSGDSEKQIAAKLSISPHTVHVYTKALHRRFGVCSRGELLARFVSGAS